MIRSKLSSAAAEAEVSSLSPFMRCKRRGNTSQLPNGSSPNQGGGEGEFQEPEAIPLHRNNKQTGGDRGREKIEYGLSRLKLIEV